jgi:hypothetical protein
LEATKNKPNNETRHSMLNETILRKGSKDLKEKNKKAEEHKVSFILW